MISLWGRDGAFNKVCWENWVLYGEQKLHYLTSRHQIHSIWLKI